MNKKFDFEKCLKEHGFVVDFYNTESTGVIMNIDEYAEENEGWYDDYFESLEKFAKEKNLKKYVFQEDFNTNEFSEIFYSKNKETVVKYIIDNFYTKDGNGYSKKFVNDHISVYKEY